MSEITEYAAFTDLTAVYPEKNTGSLVAVNYVALGAANEAGEIAGKVKKVWRGDMTLAEARSKILDEAADTLWYLQRISAEFGLTLSDLIDINTQKLSDRYERGVIRGNGDNR